MHRRGGHKFELYHPHAQKGCFTHMFDICKLVGSKDSHLGQEGPAVEFDIHYSGTCGIPLPSA